MCSIDDGEVARQVRAILPKGVDSALELVGTPTLPDTLRATRVDEVVCFTGMLSSQWTVRDFYPIDYIPRGVRLTAYGGDASDLPPKVLQDFLDAVAAGDAVVPIDHVYRIDQKDQANPPIPERRAVAPPGRRRRPCAAAVAAPHGSPGTSPDPPPVRRQERTAARAGPCCCRCRAARPRGQAPFGRPTPPGAASGVAQDSGHGAMGWPGQAGHRRRAGAAARRCSPAGR